MNTLTFYYLLTFIGYFAVIVALSVIGSRYISNLSDFMLGARSLSGPVTALGAGASDMSGWLLMALPGAVYAFGLHEIWMPVGLIIGAYLNWRFVSPRLRTYTEIAKNSLTIPAYLDNRFHDTRGSLRIITAIVVLIFFTFYAAAGFVSGALLFQSTFNIPYLAALWGCSLFIMIYTAVGGFLAINWIDFFQGSLMFFALLITPLFTFFRGDYQLNWGKVAALGFNYHNPLSQVTLVGIISLLGWGFGYFGQPHILARFMAVRSVKELPTARRICMTWMTLSLAGAITTGVVGHIYFPSLPNPESVFLRLAKLLFIPWIAGILLSAVLSAVMSTVSAQLLAASSALTVDFYQRFLRPQARGQEMVLISRCTVAAVAIMAIILASNPKGTILELVSYAWGGLGASFGPVILFSLFWKRMTRQGAIAGIITGAITVILWKILFSGHSGILGVYEIIPGFLFASLAVMIATLSTRPPSPAIHAEFEEARKNAQMLE